MLDFKQDAPGLLRVESLRITLVFERITPTTGRVSWNIPTPAAGCAADDQAYCGMLITVRNVELPVPRPTDGERYSYDNNIDPNLFAGDRIGDSQVVAALYHDRETDFVDIEGLDPNQNYYISGFPLDCELRYFRPGTHAYSQSAKHDPNQGQNGKQLIEFNPPAGPGVKTDDLTGLVVGIDYSFLMQVGADPVQPIGVRKNRLDCDSPRGPDPVKVEIQGDDALTYGDLIKALNVEFARLQGSYVSTTPPNDGQLYWDGKKLYKWDGYRLVDQRAIVSDVDPKLVNEGDIRLVLGELYQYTNGQWVILSHVKGTVDPLNPKLDQIWFNGDYDSPEASRWSGLTWCEADIIVSTEDPKETLNFESGTFWFNLKNGLYQWNPTTKTWFNVPMIIQSDIDPLEATEYLWNTAGQFKEYSTTSQCWKTVDVITSKKTPQATESNLLIRYWFNPNTRELKRRTMDGWVHFSYIELDVDPLQRSSCELWWNLSTDEVYQWSYVTSNWVLAPAFFKQLSDPFVDAYEGNVGLLWFNPDNMIMQEWTGTCFTEVEYYIWPTREVADGTYWLNGLELKKLDVDKWIDVKFVISEYFPEDMPIGTYWVNPTKPMDVTSSIKFWTGQSWMATWYTETSPVPKKGTNWTDPVTGITYEWDGLDWIPTTPRVVAAIDCNGNIVIEDTTGGSESYIEIRKDQEDLWMHLEPYSRILPPQYGEDAASNEVMYKEEGIGTDGSLAIREELMNNIRSDLGYPTITVELTPEQLDLCITKTLERLRQRSSASYKRSFYMIGIGNNTQRYLLTNKSNGENRIVQVLKATRVTSAFLSSAHGAGVYGQIVLQQLYNMGTFDLTSYHLMGSYVNTMEMLFASRLTFNFSEYTREIWFHNRFPYNERKVLLDCVVEKTEQEILQDRYLVPTIRLMATAFARMQLAEIRGKFSTMPSATGGVSLNATDLITRANMDFEKAEEDIDLYVAERVEEFGMTDFTWG